MKTSGGGSQFNRQIAPVSIDYLHAPGGMTQA
jgi:hypothetical protein